MNLEIETLTEIVRRMDKNAVWKTGTNAFGGYNFGAKPYVIKGRVFHLTSGLPRMLYREIPITHRIGGKRKKSTMPGWTLYFYDWSEKAPLQIDEITGDMALMAEDWGILKEMVIIEKVMQK